MNATRYRPWETLPWRRSAKGAAIYSTWGPRHVSVFKRPHSAAMHVKLERALSADVQSEAAARAWLFDHVVQALLASKEGRKV